MESGEDINSSYDADIFKTMLQVQEQDDCSYQQQHHHVVATNTTTTTTTAAASVRNHHESVKDLTFTPNLGDPAHNLLFQSVGVGSSASSSPSTSIFNNHHQHFDPSQVHLQYYVQPKQPNISSLFGVVSDKPLDHRFDWCDIGSFDGNQIATSYASAPLNVVSNYSPAVPTVKNRRFEPAGEPAV